MVSKKQVLRITVLIVLTSPAFFPAALVADEGKWENTGYIDAEIEHAGYLGLSPSQVFERFGAPEEIFTYRGEEEWQDNAVFYYPRHLYLFWFQNRVWQVRLDGRYEEAIAGIPMGTPRDEIVGSLGEPFYTDDRSIIYILPDIGVPVKMRLFFEEEKLSDLYLYRGDF